MCCIKSTRFHCKYVSFSFQYKCDLDPSNANKCIKSEGIQGNEDLVGKFVIHRCESGIQLIICYQFENIFKLASASSFLYLNHCVGVEMMTESINHAM